MCSVPPTRPSPRTKPQATSEPGTSTSPDRREPSGMKVGESPIRSVSRRFCVPFIPAPHLLRSSHNKGRWCLGRPTMVTFSRARGALLPLLIATACAGCSREQQDWQAAEAIHTREAYARFIEQHADSELLNEARARMAQLDEEHDWARADASGTLEAYRGFLAQHPRGPRAEQARIRIEGFSLGSAPRTQGAPLTAQAGGGVSALQLMHAPPVPPVAAAAPPVVSAAAPASAPPESASPERTAPAPPAVADPAATVTRVGADGYGVQLGAFGSEASADREWQRLRA
ncbi:MAG: SPOR domain-containing protein, partial [Gammaproteobacteria bacterium]|nr:SPOR domain-containing protein [Gammaproteobacteria bacterium]